LVGLADRVGLTGSLAVAMGGVRKRRSRHDPGRTLRDLAVMLADGGDCLADLSALRDQPTLFGDVPSHATAWRALAALDPGRVAAVRRARATARARLGAGRGSASGDPRPRRDSRDRALRQGAGGGGITSTGSVSIHCSATRRRPRRPSPGSCLRATRARTPPSTTSRCSTYPSRNSQWACAARACSSAPTRTGPPTPSSTTQASSACASRSAST